MEDLLAKLDLLDRAADALRGAARRTTDPDRQEALADSLERVLRARALLTKGAAAHVSPARRDAERLAEDLGRQRALADIRQVRRVR
jgi:hypothetical protein